MSSNMSCSSSSAAIEESPLRLNRCGDLVRRGGGGGHGGFTRLPSSRLWYCGKLKEGECRCGACGPICGPDTGCPCVACFDILVQDGTVNTNRAGDLVRKGGGRGGDGGFTNLPPSRVWYCGKSKNQCQCGECDAACGPDNGCPCEDCVSILVKEGTLRVNRAGDLVRKGGGHGGTGGFTGLAPKHVWYCGKVKMEKCRCGFCGNRCGPNNGCPCDACVELLMSERIAERGELDVLQGADPGIRVAELEAELTHTKTMLLNQEQLQKRIKCLEGDAEALQACTLEEVAEVMDVIDSASREVRAALVHKATEDARIEVAEEKAQCSICYVRPKSTVFLPCGHLICCEQCSGNLRRDECPRCRTVIKARNRVFL